MKHLDLVLKADVMFDIKQNTTVHINLKNKNMDSLKSLVMSWSGSHTSHRFSIKLHWNLFFIINSYMSLSVHIVLNVRSQKPVLIVLGGGGTSVSDE